MFFSQNYKILLTASVILGFTASPSLAITINFDNLSGGMTYLPGNPVPSQAPQIHLAIHRGLLILQADPFKPADLKLLE